MTQSEINQLINEAASSVESSIEQAAAAYKANELFLNSLTTINAATMKELKKHFPAFSFDLIYLNERQYKIFIDYRIMDHLNDFDTNKNRFKAISINYPAEYYAAPAYLTTNDLKNCYYGTIDGTLDSYIENIAALIEI